MKKAPPVPKFSQKGIEKQSKTNLQQKFNIFLNEINTQKFEKVNPSQSTQKIKEVIQKDPPKDQKKKSLASLNSKLNNMLNAKKISIKDAVTGEVQKQKSLSKSIDQNTKKYEADYDPHFPSNYELCKHNYIKIFNRLQEDSDSEQQVTMPLSSQATDDLKMQEQVNQPQQKQQLALRMMQKFGYKVGQGLGKQSQGIKTPLIVKKKTDSSGIIQQSSIPLNFIIKPQISAKNTLSAHGIEISPVICIINLIKLDELNQYVENEIKDQCKSFGVIKNWIIFLYDQELRIFVQFDKKQEAFDAFTQMNDKYYEQSLVSVRFYSDCQFQKRNLSITVHPHIHF